MRSIILLLAVLPFVHVDGKDTPVKPTVPRVAVYVDRVVDGDTVAVHDKKGKEFKIRVEGIDCPESSQVFGLDATDLLKKLTIGKTLQLEVSGKDRYQRTLGFLYGVGGENINLAMVQILRNDRQDNQMTDEDRQQHLAQFALD